MKDYAVGDIVGIKIHSADRTNTDARLLPCKVMEVSVKNGKKFYRIYSASGILKNKFTGEELADMKNVTFPSLSSADPSNLDLFIYLGFYVAFNTVQVISRRVVGRAEETST